jgi:hypothetical protein
MPSSYGSVVLWRIPMFVAGTEIAAVDDLFARCWSSFFVLGARQL